MRWRCMQALTELALSRATTLGASFRRSVMILMDACLYRSRHAFCCKRSVLAVPPASPGESSPACVQGLESLPMTMTAVDYAMRLSAGTDPGQYVRMQRLLLWYDNQTVSRT